MRARERDGAARVKTEQNETKQENLFFHVRRNKHADGQRHRTDRGRTAGGGRPRFARKRQQQQREICVTMAGMGWLRFRSNLCRFRREMIRNWLDSMVQTLSDTVWNLT